MVEILAYHRANDYGDFIHRHNLRCVVFEERGPLRLGRVAALARYLREGRFEIVHAFNSGASIWGRLAAKLARVPCIFGGYRMVASEHALPRTLNWALSKRCAGWIVLSEAAKATVLRDYGVASESVFVVYNGIDSAALQSRLTKAEARAKFELPADGAVVSIIANLRPEKNHAMFFRMARRVSDAGIKAMFVVAGDGPERGRVETLAAQAGLGSNVRLIGHCKEVTDLLRATDVGIITSAHEGLCNALIEAGAAGVPCVSSDNGGASEALVAGETGYIVRRDDATAMAHRVIRLLKDPELRRSMGAAAQQFVQRRFSVEAMGDNLLEAYRAGLAASRL